MIGVGRRGCLGLKSWDELRDVDVRRTRGAAGRLTLAFTRTGYPRLADRLTQPASARRGLDVGVAGRDDRHPHLVLELLVDQRAEDDVRVGVRCLRDGPRALAAPPQGEVAPAGDR